MPEPINTPNPRNTDTFDLIAAIKESAGFEAVDLSTEAATVAVVPSGKTIVSLKKFKDEYRLKPARREGSVHLADVDSFVAHVIAFKLMRSVVFADASNRLAPCFAAVYDYHPAGTETTDADWLGHRAIYAPALSGSWKEWSAKDKTWQPQGDFAAFIEAHVRDLIVPNFDDPDLKTFADLVEGKWATPSDMVRLSRSLQVNIASTVKNAQTLSSGEISIIHEVTHQDGAGQPLKVPNLFTIVLPVFYNGPLYRIAARLRYSVNNGRIQWMYELARPELVFDDALAQIVARVKDETNLPVFLGSPETR